MPKTCMRLILTLLGFSGFASLIASLVWGGCASNGGDRSIPAYPPAYNRSEGFQSRPLIHDRFKENINFLKEMNVPVTEVRSSLGHPHWESRELRLMVYRSRSKSTLFIAYGNDDIVTRHEVRTTNSGDSLELLATEWLKSNTSK